MPEKPRQANGLCAGPLRRSTRRRNSRAWLLLAALALVPSMPAGVRINELLARNDGGLRDADGDSSDWIELLNDGLEPVSLGGWHLTDSPTDLTQWTFPATHLPSGALLVVFASGKHRAVAGAQLHTSFQLDPGGGYLALVQPDGATIAQSLNYPAQRANVSFGRARQVITTTLLTTGAAARVFVPSNDAFGLAWTARGFDDSGWLTTNTPVRFVVGATTNTLLAVDFNERGTNEPVNTLAGFQSFVIESNLNSTVLQTQATTRVFGGISIAVSDTSTFGYDDRIRLTPANSGGFTESLLLRDFIFSADSIGTGGLDVLASGLAPNRAHWLTVWSFDSGSPNNRVSDWSANGLAVTNGYTFNGSSPPTSNARYSFGFDATTDGSGNLLLSGRRNPASLAAAPAVFLNALQISELTAVPATNGLAALMISNNATACVRVPFNVPDPADVSTLTLRIRYDDGFLAYVNGQIVASRNAPASPAWNSAATAAHPEAVAEDIPVIPAPGLLVAGVNVLAIQGLNVSAADPDFTISPELIARQVIDLGDRYFQPPTPGTHNDTGFTGLVADTKFSVDRGFYTVPFSLSISCATAGAEIRFTTNGSPPSPVNGAPFTAPLLIAGHSFIRAAAFKPGCVPGDTDTHSYIFLRDVLRQSNNLANYPAAWQAGYPADYGMDSNVVQNPVYGATISNDLRAISTLCIVSEHNGLWNSATGIYPNATSVGPAWERAASLELIAGSGRTEFAANAKIQMHGNASRDNARTPKHSIGIVFSSDYGPSKLRHDWFGGGVDVHDKIILRGCGFVDGWAGRYADDTLYTSAETGETFRGLRYRPENTVYLRDSWMKDSFRAMGWSSSRSQFVHLYLNGLYWGIYEPSEHLDASYFSLLHGGPEDAWDVIVGEDNNGPPLVVDGSLTDWQNVLNLVNAGITTEAAYQSVAQRVDLDNLVDYMMLHIFGESEDWPRHNWYVAHRRATNGVPATRFICSVWDQELTLDRLVRRNRIDVGYTGGEIYGPARVYSQLRGWPEFRRQFGDRIQKHLFNGGALAPSNNVARLLGPAAILHDALTGESARWGDARKTPTPGGAIGTGKTFTRDEWWQPEIDKLATNFFRKLTADNVARFRAGLLYPAVGAPDFSQFGGAVPEGFRLTLSHTNATGVLYFTTDLTDPRTYGSGAVAPTAQAYSTPVPINSPTLVRARVLSAGSWSALVEALFHPPQDFSKLALTEIMYNPPAAGPTNGDEFEFLELKNTGTNELNLSALRFTDGIAFTFTNGTLLAPGAFFVLARNPAAFAIQHPGVAVNGAYSGSLNNAGETLALSHPLGATLLSVTYDDEAPWPAAADGFGFSLVPGNPGDSQAPDSGARWRASANPGGSPGADDPAPSVPPILINEILTASVPPDVDRIELFNPTAAIVNLGGWFLSDDHRVPQKFRIPDGTMILPGGFVVFSEAQFNATPGTNGSFSLSSRGDSVYLFSGDAATHLTGYSHGFAFDAAAPGVSFGRHVNSVGEEQFPAQLSQTFPGARSSRVARGQFTIGQLPPAYSGTNSGPRTGPVVISEIHYHPPPGGEEFIELQNITAGAVRLFDPAHPTNVWRLNGLAYDFPTNLTLDAGARLLLVHTNPASFRARYGPPADVAVLGPYSGELQHSGERLRLERPDVPDTNGLAYITVDEVRFNDKAPWPPAADGSGSSLQRLNPAAYGNDPIQWTAAGPTPGQSLDAADTDADGMPDTWERASGTNPFVNDANEDPDHDGVANLEEFLAGTNPNDPSSYLKVDQILLESGAAILQFLAVSNRTYSLLARSAPDSGAWTNLATISAQPVTTPVTITNTLSGTSRFFRLATPATP